ncbi:asparaginase [Xanthobacter sp. DSM 24535]|uniref:asparaginase n=1 Tax=Roseixanthobacter psychrophilus TaxID=3119917 RepID=UPI003728EE72
MPHLVILATGGTIAGTAETGSGVGYAAGALAPDTLVAAVPQLAALARITTEPVAAIGSQDMDETVWRRLAARIAALDADGGGDGGVDGIVITHGTDTLEETAFFLNCVLAPRIPVVLTGAMRPASDPHPDGPDNLLQAARVALAPDTAAHGIVAVLHGEIHSATDVTKLHTLALDAFASPHRGALGRIAGGEVVFHAPPARRHPLLALPAQALPQVAILYAHAGMGAGMVEAARALGARGLVLAGMGGGNAPKGVLAALAAAVAAGSPVVRASRLPAGPVLPRREVDDEAFGFVPAQDLNPVRARLLLQLLLAHGIVRPQDLAPWFASP